MEIGVESSGSTRDPDPGPRHGVLPLHPSIGMRQMAPVNAVIGLKEASAIPTVGLALGHQHVGVAQSPLPNPAIVDVNGEVWLEQKTPDNRVCYISRLSGMIRWERPQTAAAIAIPPSSVTHQLPASTSHVQPVSTAGFVQALRQPSPSGLLPFSSARPTFAVQLPIQVPRLSSAIPPPPPVAGMLFPPPFAPIWSEHSATNGRKYYFNHITQQSTWEKPADAQIVCPIPPPTVPLVSTTNTSVATSTPSTSSTQMATSSPVTSAPSDIPTDTKDSEKSSSETQEDAKEKDNEKEKEQPTDRPVASRPIPGKAWRVVFTGDGRVFFYNPVSKVSVWEVPKELSGVSNLEKLMEPPGSKAESDDSDKAEEQEEEEKVSDVGEGEGEGEEPAAKKPKTEDDAVEVVQSAEEHAASLRATLSFEERQQLFLEMLRERNVSAFSTWEKELPKFVFDEHYLLLTPKERRGAFDVYVKTRADEERREKNKKIREKKDEFRQLLDESKLSVKSTFSEFSNRHGRDSRFKGIEKMREREALFNEFLAELKTRQKEEARQQEEKVRADFFAMLSGKRSLKPRSSWNKVKGKFENDKRYKAVDGSRLRETLFLEYISKLAQQQDDDDGDDDEDARKDRERRERVEASLREREKEVRKAREDQSKEWHMSREQHRKEETLGGFKAFLTDMVRDSELSWRDAKHVLKKDHRWSDFSLLESSERQQLFEEHIHLLKNKKRKAFHQMLSDAKVTLTSTWKEIKKKTKEDPRYERFSSSDSACKAEFERYVQELEKTTLTEFKSLLKETKIITHKSKSMMEESDLHLRDIKEVLKNDQRWLVLECMSDDRERMLMQYIEDLHKRGPPPPPTASEPVDSRRKRHP